MRSVTDLEAALRAKTAEAHSLLTANMERAEAENRLITDEERGGVEKVLVQARDLRAQIDRKRGDATINAEIERLTAGLSSTASGDGTGSAARRMSSMGDQWVKSQAFAYFKRQEHHGQSAWRSPSVEVFDGLLWRPPSADLFDGGSLQATTLTTDAASGGDLITPDMRPGILPKLFRRLVVADLLASGTTESNLVSYMAETGFTNAADTVLEGAQKPESAIVFDATSDAVRKIAHWLPVTEEMLEDASQIRSYIDARMRLGVQLAEEDQLLQGSGVAPDILGIRNRVGVAAAVARGADNNADAIYKQIAAIAANALVQPDGVVLNPANWQAIELMKDASDGYLAGGPFAARIAKTLWGLPVADTPAMAAGTGLVGAFGSAAQVFRKGGIRLEASNSHADFFIKNLVAIRAEERLALAVYRPAAFGDVTGLE